MTPEREAEIRAEVQAERVEHDRRWPFTARSAVTDLLAALDSTRADLARLMEAVLAERAVAAVASWDEYVAATTATYATVTAALADASATKWLAEKLVEARAQGRAQEARFQAEATRDEIAALTKERDEARASMLASLRVQIAVGAALGANHADAPGIDEAVARVIDERDAARTDATRLREAAAAVGLVCPAHPAIDELVAAVMDERR